LWLTEPDYPDTLKLANSEDAKLMTKQEYENAFQATHELINLGKINLESGKIVACDPYNMRDAVSFPYHVPPGKYDVELFAFELPDMGERIAYARILFRPGERVTSIELARCTNPMNHAVDSGLSSFMDEVTRAEFSKTFEKFYEDHPDGNYYTDINQAEFKKSAKATSPGDDGNYAMHFLPGSELNVAMFSSGRGDGFYNSYWARNQYGKIIALITDFKIIPRKPFTRKTKPEPQQPEPIKTVLRKKAAST
jgi:hypothetical protein